MDWFINLLECNKSASFRQKKIEGGENEDNGGSRQIRWQEKGKKQLEFNEDKQPETVSSDGLFTV